MSNIAKATDGVQPLTARDVLRVKGPEVFAVRPTQPILEVTQLLARHSLGSLVVTDGEGGVLGMLSERDILRAMARDFDRVRGLKVADLMTERVIVGLPDDTVDDLLAVMTEKRIRHLPIVDGGELTGILSIGDCVYANAHHSEVAVH